MKFIACLLCALGLMGASAQELREANFDIRFDPTAILQTGTEIRFNIAIKDADRKPVHGAQVTLRIETAEHEQTKTFRATEMDTGLYMAKPVFPVRGQWDVTIEARRDDAMSTRTKQYYVPK